MITHHMFHLIEVLDASKKFLKTLHKLGLVTEREAQVIGHHYHTLIMEKVRKGSL